MQLLFYLKGQLLFLKKQKQTKNKQKNKQKQKGR